MQRFLALILSFAIFFSRASAADTPDPAKSPVLDVFPSGQWAGMNTVFQSQNFDATIDKDRILRIQPKQDGKNAGPPVLVRFAATYVFDQRSVARDLLTLEKRPAPAMQPKKVEFAGHYEQKVKFILTIQFSDKGVTLDGEVMDPPKPKYPTNFGYASHFPVSHQIPATALAEEIRKQTEGFTVKFTDAKRQSQTMQFWEVVQSRSGVIAAGEVTGPWGTRRVITEMPPTPKNGHRIGTYGNYAVSAFYKGGWYFGRVGTDKLPCGPLTIRVE